MGSGLSGADSGGYGPQVYALAVSGSTLYAGGDFTTAGGKPSAYVAMANLAGTPVSIAIVTNNAAFGFTNGLFGFDVTGPTGSNVVIQASTDLQTLDSAANQSARQRPALFLRCAIPRQRPAFLPRPIIALK